MEAVFTVHKARDDCESRRRSKIFNGALYQKQVTFSWCILLVLLTRDINNLTYKLASESDTQCMLSSRTLIQLSRLASRTLGSITVTNRENLVCTIKWSRAISICCVLGNFFSAFYIQACSLWLKVPQYSPVPFFLVHPEYLNFPFF